MVVQDNLEACCQVFERAATDKAVRVLDKQLQDKYEERAQCRKVNRAFPGDSSAFHGCAPPPPRATRDSARRGRG